MRIDELCIHNFRGIRELEVKPEGENIGLIGPNGSGKSSVIEAIDFLLTGSVQRMTGDGTSDLSINSHGPHVDSDPSTSWVKATFSNGNDSITLKRSVESNTLEYDDDLPSSLAVLIDAADRGQHLLSRSEILNFIVARKQPRSEKLRSLLKLSSIKEKRLELQGATNNLKTETERKERELESTRNQLYELFDDVASLEEVQHEVNNLRKTLDGEPLDELDSDVPFRSGLKSPTDRASASPIQSQQTKELLENINKWFEESADEFLEVEADLRKKINTVRSDKEALQALEVLELIQNGKRFLDEEAGRCPLCLTDWEVAELENLLNEREAKASKANEKMDEVDALQQNCLSILTDTRTAVESLINILSQHEEYETEGLEKFLETLNEYENQLEGDIIEELPFEDATQEERQQILQPGSERVTISELKNRADKLPDLDMIQDAWDKLNSAYGIYQEILKLEKSVEQHRNAANQMKRVQKGFIEARDEVLNEIYDAIAGQFEEYYKSIHHEEIDFSPDISPTETGLDIQVGFHGRGKHPPHALHSEGHQDSMGLCLYLALCNYLEDGEIPLIMLDDVVMSVDAEHRRPLANLLNSKISSNFQIVITTHDELWYRHLKTEGVLSRNSTVKFSDWSLENGPQIIGQSGDEWDRIEELMKQGDVQAASSRLRHTSEWFLQEVCHQLSARVRFKSNSRWTLGDFSGPAMSRFKELLKQAKRAGNSWGHDISEINELDNLRSDVYASFQQEIGAVNPTVHYNENEWATFTVAELRPVISAFHDLYELFWCSVCDSCVHVVEDEHKDVQIKCRCGDLANWTLEEK